MKNASLFQKNELNSLQRWTLQPAESAASGRFSSAKLQAGKHERKSDNLRSCFPNVKPVTERSAISMLLAHFCASVTAWLPTRGWIFRPAIFDSSTDKVPELDEAQRPFLINSVQIRHFILFDLKMGKRSKILSRLLFLWIILKKKF